MSKSRVMQTVLQVLHLLRPGDISLRWTKSLLCMALPAKTASRVAFLLRQDRSDRWMPSWSTTILISDSSTVCREAVHASCLFPPDCLCAWGAYNHMSPQFCYTSHANSSPHYLKAALIPPMYWGYKLLSEKNPLVFLSITTLSYPSPLHLVLRQSLSLVQLASSGMKLDWYRSERAVPMLDVCLCTGEGHPRQAPFPPFIRLRSFIIPSVFPVPR